ncbi:MAG: PBECR4 domain-containing protein [Lachnospiraceae bacterium]|nr:PBECR4 domain-containing protein [Lachnospiraceae bacterium]MCI5586397.1 PBECR4 domain-containing protein [Lachnospiraceae bacterium]
MHKKTKELNELLDIYEIELCNRIFKYQLKNKIDIEIVFYKENFCHLLGLQHVYKKNKKYLGINGYNKIKNGQLKRSDLKKHNKAEYNKLEIRLDHFDEISNMLRNGHFIKFYQYRTKPLSMIVADFVIFQDKKEYILHLFLRQENSKTNQYSPVSFIVKSDNDRDKEQFIVGQEYKKIISFEIIETTTEHM